MTPGARVAAAIDVLDEILAGTPAEKALTGWARRARYAGAKDRAAVRDHVFDALRCRRSYAALGGAGTGRGLMIGATRAAGERPEALFTGSGYAPAALTPAEAAAGTPPRQTGARWDLPDWLVPVFRRSLGAEAEATALALRARAPVMLRANLGKCTPADAVDALAEDGVVARTHAIAPTALRVEAGARRVAGSRAYRAGLVELQDGSSQAAMAALPVPEGGRVLDYCAGGGGKVLALAARASAAWFAHDAAPQRMADLPARAARAGVDVRVLAPGESPSQAPFDLVLCDVPCSGSGTWRRTPDAKWRLTPEDLEALMRRQDAILDAAAPLVAPAGRLAYATCSVLAEENIDRVTAFCSRAPGWRIADSRTWPVSDAGDGFFLAILSRKDGL